MRLIFLSIYLIAVLSMASSCNNRPAVAPSANIFDSVIHQYVSSIDKGSTPSDDYSYLVYKKYEEKDTAWFIAFSKKLDRLDSLKKQYTPKPYCIKDSLLSTLSADEAYKFYFSGGLEFYKSIITIYKKGPDITLSFVQYGDMLVDFEKKSVQRFPDSCILHTSLEKRITASQWDTLTKKLWFANFWGMQSSYDYHGLDGTTWTVEGIQRDRNDIKQHSVYRWEPDSTAFQEAALYMVKLSGEKISYY